MDPKYYSHIRSTILFSIILVPLIPFLLALSIGYVYFATSLETTTVSSLKRIVEDHAEMIDTFLHQRRTNMEFVANTHSYETLIQPGNLRFVLNQLQIMSKAFVDLGLIAEDGTHVAYHGPYELLGRNYKGEPWFTEVMQKGVHVSDVFLGFREIPHFVIAVMGKENDKTWVLRATIDTYLFENMVKRVRIGHTGEAYIINEEGFFQTERRSGGNILELDQDKGYYLTRHEGINTFVGGGSRHTIFGDFIPISGEMSDSFLYATTWLKEKPWLLVVRRQKEDAFRNLRSAMYLIFFISTLGGITIIVLGYNQTERIIRRMEQIDQEKDGLQSQLIRASRMAELGQMAAGFAHEINNPLQIIRNEQALMEFVLKDLKEKQQISNEEAVAELEDSIAQMTVQIERCAAITQAILKFGRKSEPNIEDISLQEFIPEIVSMVESKANVEGIELQQLIEEETPLIPGDKSQLQQVLLNLLNNAIDAILVRHGSQGGELLVHARPTENKQVEIIVQDNGIGISPEDLKKIFSPFFTTKPVGKGTGLGLAVCYGIVDSLGGTMQVTSKKNQGTTFFVRLPAAQDSSTDKPTTQLG